MAVEFYSWKGEREFLYSGRVENGEVADDPQGGLEEKLRDDDSAVVEGVADPLDDEDYLVRRYSGPSFIAKEVGDEA